MQQIGGKQKFLPSIGQTSDSLKLHTYDNVQNNIFTFMLCICLSSTDGWCKIDDHF